MNRKTDTSTSKRAVVEALEELATLVELDGGNPFKARTYRVAAQRLGAHADDLPALLAGRRLESIEGIGSAIAKKIRTLARGEDVAELADLREQVPPGLVEVLALPGLGPRSVARLHRDHGITSLEDLREAADRDLLGGLGLGPRRLAALRAALAAGPAVTRGPLVLELERRAAALQGRLGAVPGVSAVELAGALRRHHEGATAVELVVATSRPAEVDQALAAAPDLRVDERDATTRRGAFGAGTSGTGGVPFVIRLAAPDELGAALVASTGSPDHVAGLAALARAADLTLTPSGLTRGDGTRVASTEEHIYRALGLEPVPPALREGLGELDDARRGALPALVTDRDVRGVFHVHTTMSDGRDTLEDMVAAADRAGLEFVGISDHSTSARYAGGLDEARLREQRARIDALRERFPWIRIFWGVESDIRPDGSLDYPDAVLAELDFVIGSLHAELRLDRAAQTERVLAAFENPYLTFWGHPTARMMPGREPVELDLERVLERAVERGVLLEINGNPRRLDLDWRLARAARDLGARFGLHPDAHSVEELAWTSRSVAVARKAGLERTHVLNVGSVEEVEEHLRARRAGARTP